MIFVGNDWSENHHDVEIQDGDGQLLARRRFSEGVDGVRGLHELVAEHAADPGEVVIGIETDRGLWVASMVAADAGWKPAQMESSDVTLYSSIVGASR